MNIEFIISTHTLGDSNSAQDNERYAKAVQSEIQNKYPQADVSVLLVSHITAGYCWVDVDPSDEIKDDIIDIADRVWSKDNY